VLARLSTLWALTERPSLVFPFLFSVAGLLSVRQPLYFVCCASLGYLPVSFFRAILIPLATLCVFFLSHRPERRRASRQSLDARAVRNPS
jgi:hypothetical protein